MPSILNLSEQTIEQLQNLIRINIDSERGFREAAGIIHNDAIADLFEQIAQERRTQINELSGYVELNNENAEDNGTMQGTLHRWWLSARGALAGGDDHVVLGEAERGEDAIKEEYEKVLAQTSGSPVHPVLTRQYDTVVRSHDRIKDLRDATR